MSKHGSFRQAAGMLNIVISVCLLFSGVVFAAGGSLPGTGDPNDPYLIEDLADFDAFASDPNYWAGGVHMKLMCNLNLLGKTYATAVIAPDISTSPNFQGTRFGGNFDGNSHKIINLNIDTGGANNRYLGLFGNIQGAVIYDLGIENISITGGDNSLYLGGLCGNNFSGNISNCYTTGTVSGAKYVGGFCGENFNGRFRDCYSTASVANTSWTASKAFGGFCGRTVDGSFRDCYATGSVNGGNNSENFGGLCGNNSSCTIINCYSTGSVTGMSNSERVGGLCGLIGTANIINCYTASSISTGTGSVNIGGLCGYNEYGNYKACFWDSSVNSSLADCGYDARTASYDVDLPEVFAKSTSRMKSQSTFIDEGWDFVSETNNGTNEIWQIPPDSYPLLSILSGYVPIELAGDGTLENPYLISNKYDLGAIYRYNSNANYQLTAEIDLSDITWATAPIPFLGGIFNGTLHIISNLTIDGGGHVGLFGYIGADADVKNLGLLYVDINAGYGEYVGALCGENIGGSISNCFSVGSVSAGIDYRFVGGLCGYNRGTTSTCYSTGSVIGGDDSYCLGGLCGINTGTINNCYSTNSVTGGVDSEKLGGLCGFNNSGSINDCFSTGSVTGHHFIGGLCGSNGGSISACFWDIETGGPDNGYGIPKTTLEMKDPNTFISAGWDFVCETYNGLEDIWEIPVLNGTDYPALSWQEFLTVDFVCPIGVGLEDLIYFCSYWLDDTLTPYEGGDLTGEGDADLADFAIFSINWLTGSIVPIDMAYIPDGEFEMGDHFEPEGYDDELPVHAVLLDSFFMSKYEITNQQYCDYLNSAYPAQLKVVSGIVYAASDESCDYPYCDTSTASSYSQIDFSDPYFSVRTKPEEGGRDMSDDPMVMVSWYGAAGYCNWRGSQEGYEACYNLSTWECDFTKKGYRLATEAEWEYASRGGLSGKRFPWSDPNISHSRANNYAEPSSYPYDENPTEGYHPDWNDEIWPYTSVVGTFSANGYGLYDMAGNVWEWCNDWYDSNYYSTTPYPHVNPTGPSSGTYRVRRGGCWSTYARFCRVAYRGHYRPVIRHIGYGFRIVLDLN